MLLCYAGLIRLIRWCHGGKSTQGRSSDLADPSSGSRGAIACEAGLMALPKPSAIGRKGAGHGAAGAQAVQVGDGFGQSEGEGLFDHRAFEQDGTIPMCHACGGIIKSATISFGQTMPENAMRRAEAATLACDLFFVLGSSLVVYPAAAFPLRAKRNGARLVIVNRESTPHDVHADLVLNADIGPAIGAALGVD